MDHHPAPTPDEKIRALIQAFIKMQHERQRAQHMMRFGFPWSGWGGQRGNRMPGDGTVVVPPWAPNNPVPYVGPRAGVLGR